MELTLTTPPAPEFPRRMWAGGEILFHPGWRDKLVMDGRPWACREEIGDVNVRGAQGQEKVFVDVWRRYGAGHAATRTGDWNIEERRTLVFMRNEEAAASPTPRRATKCKSEPPLFVLLIYIFVSLLLICRLC